MRRIGVLLLLAVLGAVGALVYSFQAVTLPQQPVVLGPMPSARAPAGMRLSGLPTGAMQSQAGFAWRGGSMRESREFAMTAVLVQHPLGDVLIDTGFGRDVDAQARGLPWLMRMTTTYRAARPAADQLRQPDDVASQLKGIVLTHAHWDHVSGLPDFPGVPVLLSAAEQGFVSSDARMSALAHGFDATTYRAYAFDGGPYLGYPVSHDLWGDGSFVIVPSPGHTPGSVTIFVTLPSGARYAFVGDTVWQREGIRLPAERPWVARQLVGEDGAAVRREINHLHAISEQFPQIRMMPAHDARASAELPVYPDYAS